MSRIKGNTKDERLKKWYNHFNTLLSSEENIEVDIKMNSTTKEYPTFYQLTPSHLQRRN